MSGFSTRALRQCFPDIGEQKRWFVSASEACRTIGGSDLGLRQLNVNTAYMCGRSLADRCQRAGCDARYSPLPGLPRSNGTTASRHRRPQVPLSRNYRREMPPAIADAGESLGPFAGRLEGAPHR
jgi:hypothetical protein